jgi:hypothetical protein
MDRAEAAVMDEIFAGRPPRAIAVKDAIGEMAAAGGAQLVAAVRALDERSANRALVNSFGAGGNFLAAVLEAA